MNVTIRFAFCLLTLIFFGCSKQKGTDDLPKLTIISGKIFNTEVYPTTKEVSVEVRDYRDWRSVFKDSINSDGTFKIAFDLYAPQDIIMNPVVNKVILHPGDSIYIELDFKDISKVRFSGDRVETNRALQKYISNNASILNYSNDSQLDIYSFKRYNDSIRNDALLKQKRFVEKENPPEDFIKWSNDVININYYHSILSHPFRYFGRDENGFNSWFNSTNYYDFLNEIDNDFSDFGTTIVHSDIYNLTQSYRAIIYTILSNKIAEGKILTSEERIENIINTLNDGVLKELLLGNILHQNLTSYNINTFNDLKMIIDENVKAPFIKIPLHDFYNNRIHNLDNPKSASDAIFSKMGVQGKQLLDSVIAENKGKVLFIDLWATWCRPCIAGMITANEIMPEYENDDIEFIFLCIDSTEENWHTTLSRIEIGGKHYFCNAEQTRDIRRSLGVKGIPHYFIINKDGYIVQTKSYGLTSSKDLIVELLKE